MIYITGDTHIPIDVKKLEEIHFPDQNFMTKKDYLIICGDFGGIFFDSEKERYWRDFLDTRNFTTLFVDGNHENFDLLAKFPVTRWNGGMVQYINDSIIHLCRGEIFTIEDHTFFTLGGATSIDKILREEGKSWWREELPTPKELKHASQNLEKHHYQVDYIITHTASTYCMKQLVKFYFTDYLNKYFDILENKITFKHWYFGHLHVDRIIDDKHTALYSNIVRIT